MAVGSLPSVNSLGDSAVGGSKSSSGDLAGTTTSVVGQTANGGSVSPSSGGNPNAQNIGPSTANPNAGGSQAADQLVQMQASRAPTAQVGVNYSAALQRLASQSGGSGYTPTGLATSGAGTNPSGNTSQLINDAKSWIGTPYVYGGTGRGGVDCSGFTQAVYQQMGINIGRDTTAQFEGGQHVGVDGNWNASVQALQPGDLIFYGQPGASGPNAHVVMYIGNGQIIQAAHTGTNVAVGNLFSSAASDEPFLGVRRYVTPQASTPSPLAYSSAGGYTFGNQANFAEDLLKALGAPVTNANMASITNWENREGGNWHNTAHYNPLNTTQSMPGSSTTNGVGVAAYQNWLQGLQATVQTLRNGRYNDILSALASGRGLGGNLQGLSTWSGGGYSSV
jgi:cell wall-associated NlpC family hydrolase